MSKISAQMMTIQQQSALDCMSQIQSAVTGGSLGLGSMQRYQQLAAMAVMSQTPGGQTNMAAMTMFDHAMSPADASNTLGGPGKYQALHINISYGPQDFTSQPKVDEVDGSPAGWQHLANQANQRIDGQSPLTGANPWDNSDGKMSDRVAIAWALQKNDKLRCDCNRQPPEFYVMTPDGQKHDVASLDAVKQAINQSGGFNASGYQGLGDYLNKTVNSMNPSSSLDFQSLSSGGNTFSSLSASSFDPAAALADSDDDSDQDDDSDPFKDLFGSLKDVLGMAKMVENFMNPVSAATSILGGIFG